MSSLQGILEDFNLNFERKVSELGFVQKLRKFRERTDKESVRIHSITVGRRNAMFQKHLKFDFKDILATFFEKYPRKL